jgi:hypothetical protein
VLPAGSFDITLAALKLLQQLCTSYRVSRWQGGMKQAASFMRMRNPAYRPVSAQVICLCCLVYVLQAEMLAAGVMPALSSLCPPAALGLLELLLQTDKAAAVDAMKCELLPALAAVYEHCCSNGMQQAVDTVLLLLVKPPLAPANATLPPAPAASAGQVQVSSSSTANSKKPLAAATAGTAAAAKLPAAVPASCGAGVCLQDVQSELGRCCSTVSVLAALQLLSQGKPGCCCQ